MLIVEFHSLTLSLSLFLAHQVDMSGVSRGRFLDNKAAFAGGAIYADSASTAHLASEYNHTQAQNIFGNCFVTFGNELRASLTDKVSLPRPIKHRKFIHSLPLSP